jgi:N-methylhydantoinase A
MSGGGYPLRMPSIDIAEVGAGGGSIAWIDRAGILQTGPHSAGADPGPVCYGQGGQDPTVTDANLVLGRINPTNPIGREKGWSFDKAKAEEVIGRVIAKPLGLSTTDAAWAILQVTNHRIAASIRMLTVERGYDPRDFTLVAYGGAGPLHACAVLHELEIGRVLIPPWPGITSALGCITADVRHDFLKTLNERLDKLAIADVFDIYEKHVEEGKALIAREGIHVESLQVLYQADMAYDGQIHEVRATLPNHRCTHEDFRKAFESAYSTQFGNTLGDRPLRVRTLNTAVIGVRPKVKLSGLNGRRADSLQGALKETRPVFAQGGFRDCPVYERSRLPADQVLRGPAIVEQPDATTVIEPGFQGRVDALGNLIIEEAK